MGNKEALIKRAGQLFVTGFTGETPPRPFLNFLQEEQIGGVILFEENCASHPQVRETIITLRQAAAEHPLFVAIDQEGGRVSRLRGAPAEFRAPGEYGQTDDLEHFAEDYARSAMYMEELGINLNLAPVADIRLNQDNNCLDGRCFSSDPLAVAQFVERTVQASRSAGLLSCLKHFPGLGAATIDPHEDTAVADYDLIVWEQREKIPFAAGIQAGADLLMTTHLVVPALDDLPVTGSSKIVEDLARRELSFDGPIITDDLSMKGAATLGSIGERTVAAFNAGHDLLLFGKNHELTMQAYDYFIDACHRDTVSADRLNSALNRVAGVKFKLGRSTVR